MPYEISYVSFLGSGLTTDGKHVIAIVADTSGDIDLQLMDAAIASDGFVCTKHISGQRRRWTPNAKSGDVYLLKSAFDAPEAIVMIFRTSELFVRAYCEAIHPLPINFSKRNLESLLGKITDNDLKDRFLNKHDVRRAVTWLR